MARDALRDRIIYHIFFLLKKMLQRSNVKCDFYMFFSTSTLNAILILDMQSAVSVSRDEHSSLCHENAFPSLFISRLRLRRRVSSLPEMRKVDVRVHRN